MMVIFDRMGFFLPLAFFALVWQTASTDSGTRLDVFHEVLEMYKLGEVTHLPKAKLDEYMDAVFDRFSCVANGSAVSGLQSETALKTCAEKLCLDTTQLIQLTGGNSSSGLTEEEFHGASMVALYLLSKGKHPCGATLKPAAGALTLASIQKGLAGSLSSGSSGVITQTDLQSFLQSVGKVYEGKEHGHKEGEGGGDKGDDGHGHSRKKRSSDHGDHDDDKKPRVIEAKCLSGDAVLYYLSAEKTGQVNASDGVEDVATVIIYLMSQASPVEDSCRELPKPDAFLSNLIGKLTANTRNLTTADLENLMKLLKIVPNAAHGTGDSDGHDHRRRRRSADLYTDRYADHSLSRVKRQATATTDTKCYSPAELSAIFDLGTTLTPEQLTQLSPALLYQKIYAQCTMKDTHKSETSPYKWLYGMVTVLIVCLCSLLGVVLVPCMGKSHYRLGMALFLGLAVGSLTGDAILHLIPSATGAHAHGGSEEDGHDHASGPVVVEDYVWFSLVILAGMYGFYLLEAFFIRFWRSSAHHGNKIQPQTQPLQADKGESHGHSHDFDLTIVADGKQVSDSKGENNPAHETTGNMSLTVMIVVGDAVHNFADGLAIGAAFSSSTPVGIATGIAVFCHELPHELGDFAVLLKNGLSVCRAVLWNGVSSLTAFLGLVVSLAVATDERVQTWIFAVAAGMFLYIAMTDLLPQMTAVENCRDTPVFILNNVGILLGVLVMLIIAIFEERIVIE